MALIINLFITTVVIMGIIMVVLIIITVHKRLEVFVIFLPCPQNASTSLMLNEVRLLHIEERSASWLIPDAMPARNDSWEFCRNAR